MDVFLIGHAYRYAAEQMLLTLYPEEMPVYPDAPGDADSVRLALSRGRKFVTASCRLTRGGRTARGRARLSLARLGTGEDAARLEQRLLKSAFYRAALALGHEKPVWGCLTGVRPAKFFAGLVVRDGLSPEQARRSLTRDFGVDPDRAALCARAFAAAETARAGLAPEDVCLYIGIPFCPTRCAYCSFVSQAIGKAGKLMSPYLDALLQEVRYTGEALRKSGWQARTLYIGGGTPTTLSAEQLRLLMETVQSSFDLSRLAEYTIEGGRPDTLSPEKLRLMRELGCDRISINPQTMSDAVLQAVGRTHTASDVETSFFQAREAGFENINMDLIAGLPGDDPDGFRASLDRVLALDPENVTVHTLARKRSSDLFFARTGLPDDEAVGEMVEYSIATLRSAGLSPYYLYRQKYMSGSFENVGWTKPGYSCLYNIYMMEELHPILSMGSGGMTKLTGPEGKLERFHNPKYPKEYAERTDTVLADKAAFFRRLSALA